MAGMESPTENSLVRTVVDALDRELFLAMIKSIGLAPKEFGLHSLRSGGATAAANAGVPTSLLHALSWKPCPLDVGVLENKAFAITEVVRCKRLKKYRKIMELRGMFVVGINSLKSQVGFGIFFLYTWCTRECCNRLVRTPICRDFRVNHMLRNTFPMRDY